ncbi:Aerobic cobaltochelatase subunit CobN [Candidatus Johnevansia muelleri]|uniref:Cobaltochelatase subunit CobN n=1 Tax=Candidatus Johnevansia muelleri TaxID=1495769 RepID=A0A078KI22_9GAMM|nr:Aerobic cobaltochelatase subunit CobN [Candidatus Evansia muelleri]
MRVLASKKCKNEEIINLNQTPGELIIFSAADSSISLLSNIAEKLPIKYPSIRLVNWINLIKPASFDLYKSRVIEKCTLDAPKGTVLIILSLLGGINYWQYGFIKLKQWVKKFKYRILIIVPGEYYEDSSLFKKNTVSYLQSYRIWRYLREGGKKNIIYFFKYIYALCFKKYNKQIAFYKPYILPRALIYHTKLGKTTLKEWQFIWQYTWPIAILLLYRSHIQSENTYVFNQLIDVFNFHCINILPIAIYSLKELTCIKTLEELIKITNSYLILNTTGFALLNNYKTISSISNFNKNIPILQLILASNRREYWKKKKQGISIRDIAMHIVLPELDGRIITRVIAFKANYINNIRTQSSIIHFVLHEERAHIVANIANNLISLNKLNNNEKRIAIILSNYPNSNAKIGNGVGLDTPASILNILQSFKNDGYIINNIPKNSNELVNLIKQFQNIKIKNYLNYFATLTPQNRKEVIILWGEPNKDPFYKNINGKYLLIPGIKLNNIFIGIQPARGFNINIEANYHDPELIPPHNYIAFYFWLRNIFKINAIIHIGKHGNLEWLPGKSNALSITCWPDIILGTIPNFYPFIVNDPGEGAQAKRRTQAVIIDHLMPPLSKANIYGQIYEIELIIDEYYQAINIDLFREIYLKNLIIKKTRENNLLEEINLYKKNNYNLIMNNIDAYLCEIKETQIRNGLHILGTIPNKNLLKETLILLLRLPRGINKEDIGIFHALAKDFNLPNDFDPIGITIYHWKGPKPYILKNISSRPWFTNAHTKERLEIFANKLLENILYYTKHKNTILYKKYFYTSIVIEYVQKTLLPLLYNSANNEIRALLNGLRGKFVPPGASGSPTRGKLEVLPTGRNFYTIDSFAIPSKPAWILGKKSAELLISRYLKIYGDYPSSIGISIWGTTTIRTGGDDIAQALALIGVEPKWVYQRVIDFEIIPIKILGRPRIDVTLRVSGFFRDAFLNIINLFDAAIKKIFNYIEIGYNNTIKSIIEKRRIKLITQGLSKNKAFRKASYRVFSSKPGTYGAGIKGLINGRNWKKKKDLACAYIKWGGYAYGKTEINDGIEEFDEFEERLSNMDIIIQNQDNREHDILDSGDYAYFHGGMANAVKIFRGKLPQIYLGDHSNPNKIKIINLKDELNRIIRNRLINPNWIKAMHRHGYKGAFEMLSSIDYLFTFDATTNFIKDYQYLEITKTLIFSSYNQNFLKKNNYKALIEMSERLLEANKRGFWKADDNIISKIETLLLNLEYVKEKI